MLNEEEVNELIESCNSNPVKLLIPYQPEEERELYGYDEWKCYFMISLKKNSNSSELFFIEKKYVPQLIDNLKALITRKWRLGSYQMN